MPRSVHIDQQETRPVLETQFSDSASFAVAATQTRMAAAQPDFDDAATLVGQTIAPAIAVKYRRQIEFDGTGRIRRITQVLPGRALAELRGSVIAPCAATNARLMPGHPDYVRQPRANKDMVIGLMHHLRGQTDPAEIGLLNQLRALWLDGDMSDPAIRRWLDVIGDDRADQWNPQIAQALAALNDNLVHGPRPAAVLHEDLYGRAFESAFADELVRAPPASVLRNATRAGGYLADYLQAHISTLPEARQQQIFGWVIRELRQERRAWLPETPALQAWTEHPTLAGLQAELRRVTNGFDIIKLPYLTVRISQALHAAGIPCPWLHEAAENYAAVIGPARSTVLAQPVQSEAQTSGYGTKLLYQPPYPSHDTFQCGLSVSDQRKPDMTNPTLFEATARERGQTVVCGMSGCANIMQHMYSHVARRDAEFQMSPAMLGTLMFLVFDGGHSVNEVMGTINSNRGTLPGGAVPTDRIFAARRANRDAHRLNYRQVADLLAETDEDDQVNAALHKAVDRVIDYHASIPAPIPDRPAPRRWASWLAWARRTA